MADEKLNTGPAENISPEEMCIRDSSYLCPIYEEKDDEKRQMHRNKRISGFCCSLRTSCLLYSSRCV